MSKAAGIADAIVEALDAIDGTGTYDTDLRGRVFAVDPDQEVPLSTTPVVTVAYEAIDAGRGRREKTLRVSIDVYVDADYATQRGLSVRVLLLRIHSDIEAAMYAARYSHPILGLHEFLGSSIHRSEDGATQNGLTMRFACTYSEPHVVTEAADPPGIEPAWWPNDNPTRCHDGALRLQPVWVVNDGGTLRYCVSREEMLLFDQADWVKLFFYALRAPQNITPANLTGDTLLDRPEWGTPIYRNAAWDRLGREPMDGITDPVCRSLLPSPASVQLLKAGVRPIYVPVPGGPDELVGYGWQHNATTRHTLRTEHVGGTEVEHTLRFGMSAGGSLVEWIVTDHAIGVSRNIVNNANNGFGREVQVALFGIDWNEPPGPNDTGQQNPTQGGTAYGNKTSQNSMNPPEEHPLGQGFALESILACGSPVVEFTARTEPEGGTSFDALCCPLDFVQDRYAAQISRETVYSRPGEYFLTNPIIWPTTLLRTRVWAKYRGDDRVLRHETWLDSVIDWTNPLNVAYPQLSTAFAALNHDTTEQLNMVYVYDPAADTLTDWSGEADLWDMTTPAFRQFVIGREGVYRLSPGPVTRVLDCPFSTRHAAVIFDGGDGLAFGYYTNLADNTDATRTQEIEVVSYPSPTPRPSPQAPAYGLTIQSDTRHQRRDTGTGGAPAAMPAGTYGPFTTFFVVGDLATVRARIHELYQAGALP